jgi:hypothetical protein
MANDKAAVAPSKAGGGGAPPNPGRPSDPVPAFGTFILGLYFLCLALLTFYVLVATWPVLVAGDSSKFADFSLFGSAPYPASSDLRLFITVVAAGALGSLIHCVTSFADYVGNQSLGKSWVWWLILRTPTGVAIALLFYLVLRGGLVVPSLPNGGPGSDTAHLLNPYGIAAISAMAGMFSKQATDKLREIFDTLFRTTNPVERADPLTTLLTPVVSGAEPAKLTVDRPLALSLVGRDFQQNCTASVNGKKRDVQWVSDALLKLTLLAEDVAAEGGLPLTIQNPGPTGGTSPPFTIPVEKAPV